MISDSCPFCGSTNIGLRIDKKEFKYGEVPLSYYGLGIVGVTLEYLDFPLTLQLSPEDAKLKRLKVAVKRNEMVAGAPGSLYQGVMVVSDGQGFRRYIGVTSEGQTAQTRPKTGKWKKGRQSGAKQGWCDGSISGSAQARDYSLHWVHHTFAPGCPGSHPGV